MHHALIELTVRCITEYPSIAGYIQSAVNSIHNPKLRQAIQTSNRCSALQAHISECVLA